MFSPSKPYSRSHGGRIWNVSVAKGGRVNDRSTTESATDEQRSYLEVKLQNDIDASSSTNLWKTGRGHSCEETVENRNNEGPQNPYANCAPPSLSAAVHVGADALVCPAGPK